jgi:hypothetical protein
MSSRIEAKALELDYLNSKLSSSAVYLWNQSKLPLYLFPCI